MRPRTSLDRATSPRVQLRITTLLLTLTVITLLFRWVTGANWALTALVRVTIPTFALVYPTTRRPPKLRR